MKQKLIQFFGGFFLLFALYHAAEYFVLFKFNTAAFYSLQVCFLLAAFAIARWQGFTGIFAWALRPSKGWSLQLLTGMAMGIALYGIAFYVSNILIGAQVQPVAFNASALGSFALYTFGTFFSSLSEDILTRGYLFKHIRAKTPSGLFVFTSALLYLLNHIYRLADGWQTITYIFLLGVLLAIPLVYSNRLWYTFGLHWLGNATLYFTQNVVHTTGGDNSISFNAIFIICILFMIPLQYLVLPKMWYMEPQENIFAALQFPKTTKA